MTPDHFRAIALALPEAVEGSHFGRADFRVGNRIFATLSPELGLGMAKLAPEQQEVLCAAEPSIFAPVPGGWGKRGATHIRLAAADAATLASALALAFRNVAPKRILAQLDNRTPGVATDDSPARPASRLGAPLPRLSIRRARRGDAEAMSQLIVRTIEETNSKDYEPSAILALKANFSVPEIERRLRERLVQLAMMDDALVGTASLSLPNARVHSVFVDPSRQGLGIGAALIGAVERLARRRGLERLVLASSLTAIGFYRKLGYEGARRETRPGGIETVWMAKELRP